LPPKLNSLVLSALDHKKLTTLQAIMHTKMRVEITLYNLEAGLLMDV
jgi:hypothetical protein